MPAPTNRDSDKFMLRFPDGMRDKIREAAEANGRSMNTEIIVRLEGSFAGDESILSEARRLHAETAAMLREVREAMKK